MNTDIPAITGTSLTGEYTRLRETFGYDDEVLAGLARAGADASFASPAVRARLHREIDAWLASPEECPA